MAPASPLSTYAATRSGLAANHTRSRGRPPHAAPLPASRVHVMLAQSDKKRAVKQSEAKAWASSKGFKCVQAPFGSDPHEATPALTPRLALLPDAPAGTLRRRASPGTGCTPALTRCFATCWQSCRARCVVCTGWGKDIGHLGGGSRLCVQPCGLSTPPLAMPRSRLAAACAVAAVACCGPALASPGDRSPQFLACVRPCASGCRSGAVRHPRPGPRRCDGRFLMPVGRRRRIRAAFCSCWPGTARTSATTAACTRTMQRGASTASPRHGSAARPPLPR